VSRLVYEGLPESEPEAEGEPVPAFAVPFEPEGE